jgi:hypothetical protein
VVGRGARTVSVGMMHLLYLTPRVARTPTFFTVGRNGIGGLVREVEENFLEFVGGATATRNVLKESGM